MVAKLVEVLRERQPIDVYDEVDERKESVILATGLQTLAECRKSCAVPLGIFTAMQVAAGLALPKDVEIGLSAERPPRAEETRPCNDTTQRKATE